MLQVRAVAGVFALCAYGEVLLRGKDTIDGRGQM